MKANELMIGDKILNANLKVSTIQSIERSEYVYMCGKEKGYGYIECCEAIPLTPEILEKNGFDISDREVMRYNFSLEGQKESFVLKQMYDKETKEPKGFSYFVCNVLTIFDYVHQLQHALRLVGLTKLADNFRV